MKTTVLLAALAGLLLIGAASADRGGWVKDQCNQAAAANPGYNVLICNIDQDCNPALSGGPGPNGSPSYQSASYEEGFDTIHFGIWAFKSGSLNHCNADGGFINWCFTGGSRTGNGGCQVNW